MLKNLFPFFVILFPVFSLSLSAEDPVRIVIMETMPVHALLANVDACTRELGSLGYTSENAEIVHIKADGSREKAEDELGQLLQESKPDIIISFATLASQAAVNVAGATGIPIVFAQVSDPVGSGIVQSMDAHPESSVTGIIYTIPREVKLFHAISVFRYAPTEDHSLRIGFIHSSYPSSTGAARELQAAAAGLAGVEIISQEIPYKAVPAGIDEMLEDVKRYVKELDSRIDYWWEPTGPLGQLNEYHRLIMAESSKPILFAITLQSVIDGAVMTLMSADGSAGAEAAHLAHKILSGTPAGSIPIQDPQDVTAAFNRDTILKNGLVVPPGLLSLAAGNIFPRMSDIQ